MILKYPSDARYGATSRQSFFYPVSSRTQVSISWYFIVLLGQEIDAVFGCIHIWSIYEHHWFPTTIVFVLSMFEPIINVVSLLYDPLAALCNSAWKLRVEHAPPAGVQWVLPLTGPPERGLGPDRGHPRRAGDRARPQCPDLPPARAGRVTARGADRDWLFGASPRASPYPAAAGRRDDHVPDGEQGEGGRGVACRGRRREKNK